MARAVEVSYHVDAVFVHFFRMKKFFVALFACGLFVLGGCQQAGDDPNAHSGFTTSQGVKAESFLPQESFMVVKFGTDDAQQKANLEKLASYFPQEAWKNLMIELARDFNDEFAELGMTFEDDLLPAIGDNAQIMIGFFGEISEEEEPDILAVLSFAQPDTFAGWMEAATSEGNGQKQSYKNYSIYNGPGQESYIVPYKDVLIMGSTVKIVKEAIDRAEAGGPSLLGNSSYQKGLAKMPNAMGFFFIDPRFSLKVLESDPEVMKELGDTEFMEDVLEAIEGEFFAFSAEEDGIRIAGAVYGDVAKWKELEDIANFDVEPAYLYRTLPGEGVLLYMESSNFQKSAKAMMQMYKNMEGFDEGMDAMKSALQAQGIDFDSDVLGFMDRGYAMGFYDLGSIIPSFGMFVDASSNRAGAEKVMAQLYSGIDGQLQDLPAELEPLLSHEESVTKGQQNYGLALDITKLPEEELAEVPEELRSTKLEFHYGVDTDDLAYFAFYPGFDVGDYTTMETNDRFRDALADIPGFDRGISYFDIEGTMAYVDRVVDFAQRMEGGSADDLGEYQMVRAYVSPIKSLIMAAAEAAEGEVELQGFLQIGSSSMEMMVPGMEEDLLSKEDCIIQCEIQAVGRAVVDDCIAQC